VGVKDSAGGSSVGGEIIVSGVEAGSDLMSFGSVGTTSGGDEKELLTGVSEAVEPTPDKGVEEASGI